MSLYNNKRIKMKTLIILYFAMSYLAFATFDRNNTSGVVIDSITTLEWQDDYDNDASTTGDTVYTSDWEIALSYCKNLTLDTVAGVVWRLPNQNELLSLVDDSQNTPAIDSNFVHITSSIYWSSTREVREDKRFIIDFTLGIADIRIDSETYSIRCVRTGPLGRAN